MTTPNPNSCDAMSMMLDAFHDGELAPDERVQVEQHLAACPACSKSLREIEAVASSLRALPELKPMRDFSLDIDKIISKSEATKPEATKPNVIAFTKRSWLLGSIAVAAAVALFALVITSHSSITSKEDVAALPKNAAQDKPFAERRGSAENAATKDEIDEGDELASSDLDNSKNKENGSGKRPHATKRQEAELAALPESGDDPASKGANSKKSIGISAAPPVVASAGLPQNGGQLSAAASLGAGDQNGHPELVAVYDPEQANGVTEELGITTDEDGLYAIKL
ncbi:MAG TPA: zf-HC2 domain-containing protein [Chroococcales cyanobacterium]